MKSYFKTTIASITFFGIMVAIIFLLCIKKSNRIKPCSLEVNAEMSRQAEQAIEAVGGAVVLGDEAVVVLRSCKGVAYLWDPVANHDTNCPSILQLTALLSPLGHGPWIVKEKQGLPRHIVIRFGSHSSYAYVWIFDPAAVPDTGVLGMTHFRGPVYLSGVNR